MSDTNELLDHFIGKHATQDVIDEYAALLEESRRLAARQEKQP